MNFYLKPLSNFKLECWSIDKELQEGIQNFLEGSLAKERSEMPKLLSAISSMCDACLILIVLSPFFIGSVFSRAYIPLS